jgi:hypothetical protein
VTPLEVRHDPLPRTEPIPTHDDEVCNRAAESVITGRKSGADMARLYNISQPTVSRIVAAHRRVPTMRPMEERTDAGLKEA